MARRRILVRSILLAGTILLTACDNSKPPVSQNPPTPKPAPPAKKIEWKFKLLQTIPEPVSPPGLYFAPALSPDGKWVAAILYNGPLTVWDAETGKPVFTSDRHLASGTTFMDMHVRFDPTGRYLAAFYTGVWVDLYSTNPWGFLADNERCFEPLKPKWGSGASFVDAAFSPDGRMLAWSQTDTDTPIDLDAMIRIVTMPKLRPITRLPEGQGVSRIAFSKDSKILFTGGGSHRANTDPDRHLPVAREQGLRRWDVMNWRIDAILMDRDYAFEGYVDGVHERSVSIAYGEPGRKGRVATWDLKQMKKIKTVDVPENLLGCDPCPGGDWFLGDDGEKLLMVDPNSGVAQPVFDLSFVPIPDDDHRRDLRSFRAFSDDGRRAAISAMGPGILIFDVQAVDR